MTRARILAMLVVFASLGVGLAIGLADLMLVEHEDWLERSYRNRWAFRDVPTRRGAILDRLGRELAGDRPGFDLELHYRQFRRSHAIGLAVHGANCVQRAHGLRATFRFDEPDGYEPAARLLCMLPVAWFGPNGGPIARSLGAEREPSKDHVRDVRFYVCNLLAELSGTIRPAAFHVAIRRALEQRRELSVRALADEVCQAARKNGSGSAALDFARLRQRADELEACALRLGDLAPGVDGSQDLLAFLEERRAVYLEWQAFCELPSAEQFALRDAKFCAFVEAHGVELRTWRDFVARDRAERERWVAEFAELSDDAVQALRDRHAAAPWNEDVPRVIRRRMSYETAVWLRLLRDRHAGFMLRPAVRRVRGTLPGTDDLGTLEPVIGSVSPLWRDDTGEGLRGWTESLGELGLEEFFDGWDAQLTDGLESTLRRSASRAVYQHYVLHGRRGRGGVEQVVDGLLAGAPGMRFVERDRRNEQRLFSTLDVKPGADARLTIDADLQALLDRALARAESGTERAAALVDARTGDILALSSWPPSLEDGRPRFMSLAAYPRITPYVGSVVKPFVVLEHLASVRAGRAAKAPSEFRPCRRSEGFRRTQLRCNCSGGGPAGNDPVLALAHSCNWYLFTATVGLGRDGFQRGLRRVGLDVDSFEVFGFPRGSLARPRINAGGIQLAKQGIGYGVEASALAVARAYAGLATGVLPTLGLVVTPLPRAGTRLDVDPADLAVVRSGLQGCVEFGTARFQDWSRFGIVGKTGTAEITDEDRSNNAWFAGYAPPSKSGVQLAFAVVAYLVPDRSGGGKVAAPVVHDLFSAIRDDARLAADYLPEGVR